MPSKLDNLGEKYLWIAVKSNSTKNVLLELQLLELAKTNWKEGLNKVRTFSNYKYSLISESIDGWVLIIGWGLPTPLNTGLDDIERRLNELSKEFGEAHEHVEVSENFADRLTMQMRRITYLLI